MNYLFDKLYAKALDVSIPRKNNGSVTRVRGTVPGSMSQVLNKQPKTVEVTNSFRPYYGMQLIGNRMGEHSHSITSMYSSIYYSFYYYIIHLTIKTI